MGEITRFPLEKRIQIKSSGIDSDAAFFREYARIQRFKEKWRRAERSLLAKRQAELRRGRGAR